MKLSELAKLLGVSFTGKDVDFSSLSTDTRDLAPGQLYIAIQGEHFDGHDFLDMAYERKAVAALVSREVSLQIPTLKVSDTRAALGEIAAHHRRCFEVPVLAVTGSCGKTTIKAMLANILTQMGPTLSPVKSFNNNIGVPLTLLQLSSDHKYAVIEMGANHPEEISYLSSLAQQSVAIISNVGPAHLAGFGSLEGVACAKGEIYDALPSQGVAVINNDDTFADYWKSSLKTRKIITFGIESEADVTAKNIQLSAEGKAKFELNYPGGRGIVQLSILGKHNVMNALAATAASYVVGATFPAIIKGLETVSAVTKRLVTCKGFNGSCIIDDSYNANPLSVSAALEILAHSRGEKIFVFGDMGELGSQEVFFHTEIGQKAKELGISKLYTCGDLAKLTAEAFGENGFNFRDQETLIHQLRAVLDGNTTALVKGSRSSRMENVVKAISQEV